MADERPCDGWRTYRMAMIENMVTVVATAAFVLGLYWMGAGGWSAGGFLLLCNINAIRVRSDG